MPACSVYLGSVSMDRSCRIRQRALGWPSCQAIFALPQSHAFHMLNVKARILLLAVSHGCYPFLPLGNNTCSSNQTWLPQRISGRLQRLLSTTTSRSASSEPVSTTGSGYVLTRSRSSYTGTITVLVGGDEYAFTVHESLLCGHADFFKAACSAGWKEGQTRTVRLPPATPAHFEIYLDWLYSQQQANLTDKLTKILTEEGLAQSVDELYQQQLQLIDKLCDMWLLADYILDTDFKNKVMDAILMHDLSQHRLIMQSTIRKIITNTTKESGLQRWTIEHLALFVAVLDLDAMHEWLQADVVFEVLKKMVPYRLANTALSRRVPTLQSKQKFYDCDEASLGLS